MSKSGRQDKSFSPSQLLDYGALVVGCGFAGAIAARELAERLKMRVAILEKRPHIAGNAYDSFDQQGVLIHQYGPHIFHTNSERVHTYLSRFTQWRDYQHEVLALIAGCYIPVPFNLNSIALSFESEKAEAISALLVAQFGMGAKVPIIDLRKQEDPLLRELADYVYENVFLHYTTKQWGLTPEEIDPAVTARVPVLVDVDNRYFQDLYQGLPLEGYTPLFENLLDYPGIDVFLDTDARDVFTLKESGDSSDSSGSGYTALEIEGAPYEGIVIYTGALDELCDNRFGLLPYRSLDFVYRYYKENPVQPCGTVNFTLSEDYTRTSEYTWLTGQQIDASTIAEEYPRAYHNPEMQIPYYPIIGEQNQAYYQRYVSLFDNIKSFYVLGRLAEYRYYNMDQIALRALELIDEICTEKLS